MSHLKPPSRFKRLPGLTHWGRGLAPLSEAVPAMEQWFKTPAGRELLSRELTQLDEVLACLFGYHLCQMSICRDLELATTSRIRHRFLLNPLAPQSGGRGPAALADPAQLPLPHESIDVVLLHHILEFTNQPHQVLREAARVLIPRGHLIIVGFNPWSLLGIWRFLAAFGGGPHWHYQAFGVQRLSDWLRLLEIEPTSLSRGFYRLPLQGRGLLSGFSGFDDWCERWQWPGGGFYLLVARKEITPLTPIRPHWRTRELIPGLSTAKRSVPANSRINRTKRKNNPSK